MPAATVSAGLAVSSICFRDAISGSDPSLHALRGSFALLLLEVITSRPGSTCRIRRFCLFFERDSRKTSDGKNRSIFIIFRKRKSRCCTRSPTHPSKCIAVRGWDRERYGVEPSRMQVFFSSYVSPLRRAVATLCGTAISPCISHLPRVPFD